MADLKVPWPITSTPEMTLVATCGGLQIEFKVDGWKGVFKVHLATNHSTDQRFVDSFGKAISLTLILLLHVISDLYAALWR